MLVLGPALAQQTLRIVPVEGSGARNVVQQITARPITVRVEDARGMPVADARVIFSSPASGPSGEFNNAARTLEVTTNSRGLASANNYHPNAIAGSYNIDVRAEYQGQTARIQIPQENVTQGKSRRKLIAILAIAGGAAGAILASSLKKKSSGPTTPTTPPTITLGDGSVGAPTTP
jgi:hypothetical protein